MLECILEKVDCKCFTDATIKISKKAKLPIISQKSKGWQANYSC